MDLRQLEYFVAVVEEANFTRAAERVGISQSGVSAQIRQLEGEVGHALLDRSERTVRPTAAGEALLPHARAALGSVVDAGRAIDELGGLVRGSVRVGMVTARGITALFDGLSDFHALHPGIDITLHEAASDQLISDVRTRTLDLAIAGWADTLPADVDHQVVFDERVVAAVARTHPLAQHKTISLAALGDGPLVCLAPGTGIRTAFGRACAAQGIGPAVSFEASAPEVVAGLAVRQLGVAILSESMAAGHAEELAAVPIVRPAIRSKLGLVWRRGEATNPAATALVGQLRTALA